MSEGLSGLKVLLVDDNRHMRAIVSTVLKSVGIHDVVEAGDGAEGLQMLRRWPIDIAMVDFCMEPIDGVAFTTMVRNSQDSTNPYLPIIMMTGHADRVRVVEARDAGVTELVVKPVTARAILDRLNAVVFHPRAFVKTDDYFGPLRRGIDDTEARAAGVTRL